MIEILTLGNWDIRHDKESIFESKGYQEKLLKLFAYFLIFHGQRINQGRIIDDLFSYDDYSDPRNTLRTQVSRLRHMIDFDDFFTIKNLGGYYVFKLEKDCKIDFVDFEGLVSQGNYLVETNPHKAIELLDKGLSLYKGELLKEINEDWLIPQRTRYDRLYLNGINNYLSLLMARREYSKVLQVTEEAIGYHPYEEMINIYYIESLINLNQRAFALSHYEYFTKRLYSDYGLVPSEEFKKVYQTIKHKEANTKDSEEKQKTYSPDRLLELPIGEKRPMEIESWNLEFFNALEDIGPPIEEKIHAKSDYLILVNIRDKTSQYKSSSKKENIDKLAAIINKGLRADDGLYRCMDGPLLLKLKQISYYNIQTVQERLEQELIKERGNKDLSIEVRIKIIK